MKWTFPRRVNSAQKPTSRKRRRRRLKAASLAVGLVTAWGGEASANVIMQLQVTPTRALRDAYVYYGNNQSTADFLSLGTLPANQMTVFNHTLTGQFDNQPQFFQPNAFRSVVGYFVIGVFDQGTTPAISVSFPNDSPITSGKTWNDIFNSGTGFDTFYNYDEQQIAGYLAPPLNNAIENFSDHYGDGRHPSAPLPTLYGHVGTLVNFSTAEFGGIVFATIVPEPSSITLVSAAGIILVGGALIRRPKRPCN